MGDEVWWREAKWVAKRNYAQYCRCCCCCCSHCAHSAMQTVAKCGSNGNWEHICCVYVSHLLFIMPVFFVALHQHSTAMFAFRLLVPPLLYQNSKCLYNFDIACTGRFCSAALVVCASYPHYATFAAAALLLLLLLLHFVFHFTQNKQFSCDIECAHNAHTHTATASQ